MIQPVSYLFYPTDLRPAIRFTAVMLHGLRFLRNDKIQYRIHTKLLDKCALQ